MNWRALIPWIAGLVILVAGLDLLLGNTSQAILPSFLGNILTQNIDVLLIAAAVLLLILL